MFLITSSNSIFIRGVLVWQLNYFYHKVDIISPFERKHETEIMGPRSKPAATQFLEESLTGKEKLADGIFLYN